MRQEAIDEPSVSPKSTHKKETQDSATLIFALMRIMVSIKTAKRTKTRIAKKGASSVRCTGIAKEEKSL